MYRLPDVKYPFEFPNDFSTTPEGLLAVGGNLLPETLVDAYSKGIFPWFSEGDPILWWHPSPRLIILPNNVHVSTKMRRLFNKSALKTKGQKLNTDSENELYFITINKNFKAVIQECAQKRSKGRDSTWITSKMTKSYTKLHDLGYAHSIEVWNRDDKLVGGMYGIAIGKIFFGESMFSHEPNASKLALFHLCQILKDNGFLLLDCQVESEHLKTLGAQNISREQFMDYLKKAKTDQKKPSAIFNKFK